MQSHRTELSADSRLRSAPPPPVGTVQGLGLSDALRVELQPSQVSGLIDELDEMQGPLAETYECARRRWLEVSRLSPDGPATNAAESVLSGAAYRLRALAALRAQAPTTPPTSSFVIVGPASLVSELVMGASRHAASELSDLLLASSRFDPERAARLRRTSAAALAWVETYSDCQSVEWYSFDSSWDPVTVL